MILILYSSEVTSLSLNTSEAISIDILSVEFRYVLSFCILNNHLNIINNLLITALNSYLTFC